MSEADTEQGYEVDQERTEANRAAHRLAGAYLRDEELRTRYHELEPFTAARRATSEAIRVSEKELKEAKAAYERFITEQTPEVERVER